MPCRPRGLFGTGATDFFCSAVERGSRGLVLLLRNPALVALLLALLVAPHRVRGDACDVDARRTAATGPAAQLGPDPVGVRVDVRAGTPLVFLGHRAAARSRSRSSSRSSSGSCSRGSDAFDFVTTGEVAGGSAFLALVIGTTLALLSLALVQAATACALLEIDAGRQVTAVTAYAEAFDACRPLLARQRRLRPRVGRPDDDDVPDPGRDLARDPLVPARADRDARGGSCARRAPPKPRARRAGAGCGRRRSSG